MIIFECKTCSLQVLVRIIFPKCFLKLQCFNNVIHQVFFNHLSPYSSGQVFKDKDKHSPTFSKNLLFIHSFMIKAVYLRFISYFYATS